MAFTKKDTAPAAPWVPPIRDLKSLLEGYREEKRSYEARLDLSTTDEGLRAKLVNRISQVEKEIENLTSQLKTKHRAEIDALEAELGE